MGSVQKHSRKLADPGPKDDGERSEAFLSPNPAYLTTESLVKAGLQNVLQREA